MCCCQIARFRAAAKDATGSRATGPAEKTSQPNRRAEPASTLPAAPRPQHLRSPVFALANGTVLGRVQQAGSPTGLEQRSVGKRSPGL
jgi:hypothetical protein